MNKKEIITDLMNRYGTEVLHLAYSYVRNRQTAEDLAQEIFIKCYEKLDSFNEESALETWMYRVAVNHCKDYLKSWYNRKIHVTDYISSFFTSSQSGAENEYIQEAERNELVDAVFRLPVKYREVIFLYYFRELSQKEISEVCGLNLNTVKSRMLKGKKLLKNIVEDRGDDYFYGKGNEQDQKSNA